MTNSGPLVPVVGEHLPEISIPITLQRLVMEAGANRDFSLMHHDGSIARTAGASDAFANTFFLMGMFERLVRDWAGPQARFTKMGPLKMLNFNIVGDTMVFKGVVELVETTLKGRRLVLELWCESERGQTTTCMVELISP